jgi:hypothetical protein
MTRVVMLLSRADPDPDLHHHLEAIEILTKLLYLLLLFTMSPCLANYPSFVTLLLTSVVRTSLQTFTICPSALRRED